MNEISDEKLVEMAREAREKAYAPYSKYHVGAALLCDDGSVYTGCNIESASYPCGICAERNAMSTAINDGKYSFKAIAVIGSGKETCTPCGMCRQFMYEFAPTLRVLCCDCDGKIQEHALNELLSCGFGPKSLG